MMNKHHARHATMLAFRATMTNALYAASLATDNAKESYDWFRAYFSMLYFSNRRYSLYPI
jgi:hypothetical protein